MGKLISRRDSNWSIIAAAIARRCCFSCCCRRSSFRGEFVSAPFPATLKLDEVCGRWVYVGSGGGRGTGWFVAFCERPNVPSCRRGEMAVSVPRACGRAVAGAAGTLGAETSAERTVPGPVRVLFSRGLWNFVSLIGGTWAGVMVASADAPTLRRRPSSRVDNPRLAGGDTCVVPPSTGGISAGAEPCPADVAVAIGGGSEDHSSRRIHFPVITSLIITTFTLRSPSAGDEAMGGCKGGGINVVRPHVCASFCPQLRDTTKLQPIARAKL